MDAINFVWMICSWIVTIFKLTIGIVILAAITGAVCEGKFRYEWMKKVHDSMFCIDDE